MRVIIAGSRDFNDYNTLERKMNIILKNQYDVTIISGTARGADKLGERYAGQNHHKLEKYPAMWDLYGKSAGYKRNEEMANTSDAAVVFWDGKSKGTKHMIDISKKFNLKLRIIKF
jgi:hypothetical protein|tara:strand:+ start:520 stop:867 length:348 start_codon:yes stop_codon:yes gene_type:complete